MQTRQHIQESTHGKGELTSDDETTLKSDHEITTTTTEPKELKIE